MSEPEKKKEKQDDRSEAEKWLDAVLEQVEKAITGEYNTDNE